MSLKGVREVGRYYVFWLFTKLRFFTHLVVFCYSAIFTVVIVSASVGVLGIRGLRIWCYFLLVRLLVLLSTPVSCAYAVACVVSLFRTCALHIQPLVNL